MISMRVNPERVERGERFMGNDGNEREEKRGRYVGGSFTGVHVFEVLPVGFLRVRLQ